MNLSEKKQLFIYIFLAYFFSVLIRLIWVYQFNSTESFIWNDQLMINTNDGYVFAETARNILNGTLGYIDGINNNGATGFLTAILVKILPFKFETIILYMPTFLGSLLVVPLILLGYTLKKPYMGFIAGIFASIAWSYYNRTMTGYYDSDMLNIVTPMFVLWSIVHALTVQKNRFLVLMIVFMILSEWWYPKNIALNTAMLFIGAIYVMIKDMNNIFNLKLIAFGLIGLSLIPIWLKILVAILLFGLFHFKESLGKKTIWFILLGLGLLYVMSGSLNSILSSLNLYVINRFFPTHTIIEGVHLQFYDVIKTVREASAIPFETFANRISGNTITFLISTIGVLLMFLRYPVLLVSLPMVAMGFMAYKSGLRFTVYAVPVYALGFGYIIMYIVSFMKDKFVKVVLATSMVCLALYPNIKHIISYKVPTVLNKAEVQDLDKLRQISNQNDYTLSWWDYGYPIRYYTYTKTLIDGGKHNNDNFIISKIMQTTSPELAANLSRLAVETYVDSNYSVVADTIFKTKTKIDPNLFLESLKSSDYKLPKKSRNIYLYFPYRMLNIFPTVAVFGNLDLTTGQKERQITFYPTTAVANKEGIISFRNGIVFDAQRGIVTLGNQKVGVKNFIITQLEKDGKIKLQSQRYSLDGKLIVIYMKNYGRFIVMDVDTFYSMYVQMFILGKYDKKLFNLVISSPYSRIYKLKI